MAILFKPVNSLINSAVFSGTADPNAVLTFMEGTVVIGLAFADALGAWTFTPSPALADGSHTLTITETSAPGVVALPPAVSVTFTLDTVAPVVKVVLTTDTGIAATDNITKTATINGTADAGATVTILEGTKVLGTTVAGTAGAWTFTPTPATFLDGAHILTANETDAAGNVGSSTVGFILDTKAQPAAVTGVVGSGTAASVVGTGEVGSALQLFEGTTQIGVTTVRSDGSWAIAAPMAPGNHTFSITETDVAGNIAATAAKVVTIAASVPDLDAASDSGQSNTDNITNVTKLVFTGNGLPVGATVQLFDNGVPVAGTFTVDLLGNWKIATTTLFAPGVHSITAKQTFAGITSTSAPLLVTIDTAAPLAPSKPSLSAASDTGASSSDNITSDTTPIFSGTAEAGSLVTLFDSVTVNKVTTTTQIASITAAADGTWTTPVSVPLSNAGPNGHSISAVATDVAGNVSAKSGAQSITIDTIAPAPVINSMTVNTNGSVTLAGSVEASAIVTVVDLTAALGTTVADKVTGAWKFTTASTLTDTLHVFLTRGSDLAGNASPITGQSGSAQVGSSVADVIKSTTGNDFMFGGAGADTFTFGSVFGKDIIQDFTLAGVDHDIINFHANSALNNFVAVQAHAKQVGTGTVITQDANNVLTLANVTTKSLVAGDFSFA